MMVMMMMKRSGLQRLFIKANGMMNAIHVFETSSKIFTTHALPTFNYMAIGLQLLWLQLLWLLLLLWKRKSFMVVVGSIVHETRTKQFQRFGLGELVGEVTPFLLPFPAIAIIFTSAAIIVVVAVAIMILVTTIVAFKLQAQ